jgi:DNA-binding winged helix-turn-helix (wHTH) protein/dipeptidyl aminopeptidase/acylaminoacyl peptidase
MPGKIRFGVYELDRDAMELRKRGVLLRLQEQPFRVLAMLAERPGEIITREQLQEQIWGNTFVDFDQSLNKAVNRVREALNDNAGRPQYIETVPRRGYRFIATVAEIPATEALAPAAPVSPATPAQPNKSPSRIVVISALAGTVVLTAIGIMTVAWLRQQSKAPLQEPRLVVSFGWQPTLSRDGKLLAYVSSVGSELPHIWLQQTAGGGEIRVTSGSDPDYVPDFSPDGTHIAFYSERGGGGIYIAPSLPGEPRLLVAHAGYPRFSPTGERVLYWQGKKAFTVSVDGGQPVALPFDQDFSLYGPPLWAPNGNEILFYGIRSGAQDKPAQWWVAPVGPGQARLAHLPGVEQNSEPGFAVRAWIRTTDGREWIVYSTAQSRSWKLWQVGVSAQGDFDQKPELLASGIGGLNLSGSALADGKLAYSTTDSEDAIYQIPIGERGQKLGPIFQLPLPQARTHLSPSVSRDGKWMAYDSYNPGKPDSIVLRDLSTGTDHLLDDKGRSPGEGYFASISPDGSRVIFERDCKQGTWPHDPASHIPCSFIAGSEDGEPKQVCERCTARGFSSDGSVVLLQKYGQTLADEFRIAALDLRTGKERDFLSSPGTAVVHAFFSWDDRWVVFRKLLFDNGRLPIAELLIAPVRNGSAAGEAEWIAVTDGKHGDDKPQFSADGNTLYFTSTRDEYLCIWAQRLDPVTKHPLGSPFAYEHFHNAEGRAAVALQGQSDLSVARDKILINLPQVHSEIWMTQLR